MKTHAFIFARGGSKGIVKKNLRQIGGKSLVGHAISQAQTIEAIDTVFVSSDDAEILREAENFSAKAIVRPKELATDTASEWHAWQHAVRHVANSCGTFDRFLSLPPTAPLRSSDDIIKCLNSVSMDCDLVVTMSEARRNPWFNMVRLQGDGSVALVNGNDARVARRQDSPECFDLATVCYATTPEFILGANGLWDGVVKGVTIPPERAVDIDTEFDFYIAQFLYHQKMEWQHHDDEKTS